MMTGTASAPCSAPAITMPTPDTASNVQLTSLRAKIARLVRRNTQSVTDSPLLKHSDKR